VADLGDAALLGVPADRLLDALVFSSPGRPWRDVMVAGRWVLSGRQHAGHERIARRFEVTTQALWGDSGAAAG
jgi:formimidoylglutamate deiminase